MPGAARGTARRAGAPTGAQRRVAVASHEDGEPRGLRSCPMLDRAFWAAAYYRPLGETLAAWEASVRVSERFAYVMEHWWAVLQDGLQDTSGRPQCLAPYDESDWFVQRLILLYVCHVPYVRQGAPEDAQPFLPLLRRYAAGAVDAWMERHADTSRLAWHSTLQSLLDPQKHGELCKSCPHLWMPGLTLFSYVDVDDVTLYEADVALRCLTQPGPLSVHQNQWVYDYVRTVPAHLAVYFAMRDGGPCQPGHIARVAVLNTRTAYEWMLLSMRVESHVILTLLDVWGDALASMPPARVASVLVRLMDVDEMVQADLSPTCALVRAGWLVQYFCMPKFVSLVATRVEYGSLTESDVMFLCGFAQKLVEDGRLTLRALTEADVRFTSGSPKQCAATRRGLHLLIQANLETVHILLNMVAVRQSRHTYGAALYRALTEGARRADAATESRA